MIKPIAASESETTEVRAALPLKRCSLYLVPPNRMERPSTSSTLPMIDPVREAFTTLVRPLERATPAMISSAAFPKVALSNPPKPPPTRAASASVARPIQPATGMMPRAEQTKSAVGLMPPGQKRRRTASGTKLRSQSRDGLSFRSRRISRLGSANQLGPSPDFAKDDDARLGVGAAVLPRPRDEDVSLPPALCCNGTNVARSTA